MHSNSLTAGNVQLSELRKPCKYGDPLCPCQDGDMCHYDGPNPWRPPSQQDQNVGPRRDRSAIVGLVAMPEGSDGR